MKKKILIVDDEKAMVALMSGRLEAAGYEVFSANDGKNGVKLAREKKPDLILLDIMMPGMDGVEMSRSLQEQPATRGIPVIFITSLKTAEEEKTLGKSGNRIFAKPIDPKVLLSEIEQIVQSS